MMNELVSKLSRDFRLYVQNVQGLDLSSFRWDVMILLWYFV